MIDITKLDPVVLENLRNRGHSDERIKQMNWDQVFDEYCHWEGLIRWGSELRRVMANAKNAQT
jgi:hypothetical protein